MFELPPLPVAAADVSWLEVDQLVLLQVCVWVKSDMTLIMDLGAEK